MRIVQLGAKVGPEFGMGRGNAGDTAVGEACTYVYQTEFPDCEITYMNCRQIFDQKHIDEINTHDILFVGGGGLFLSDTFPNTASGWQWGIPHELLLKIKIPIVVYAIGYNKFRGQDDFSEIFNKSVSTLVEKSLFFSMRNTGSCNAIKKHIPEKLHSKISLNFCPTIIFEKKFKNNFSRNSSVGFLLGGDRLNLRHKDLENYVKNMQEFLLFLKQMDVKTILINHQNDNWISKFLEFDEYKDLYKKPVDEIYDFYFSIDTVVSDRGHGQMIPFACGCKIISPISHDKLSWFLDNLELPELKIDENDPNLGKLLISKYKYLSTLNWNEIHKSRMQKIKENYQTNMALIKSNLSNATL